MDTATLRQTISADKETVSPPVASKLSWRRIEEQARRVSRLFPKNARVLDIGCGAGHNTTLLKLLRPDITLVGLEPNRNKSWDTFKKYGITFKKGSGLKLPFKNQEFDVVTSFGVLEHVKEHYKPKGKPIADVEMRFLQEINRVLKKDGLNIILNLPNKYSWTEKVADYLKLSKHPFRYSKKQITQLLNESGFVIDILTKDFFLPSQITRLNSKLLPIFDTIATPIYYTDKVLNFTPLNAFSQSHYIICRKK